MADKSRSPRVLVSSVLDDNTQLTTYADTSNNTIFNVFDVHVINSRIISKPKKAKIGGTVIATASLEVEPVVLVSKIPPFATLSYNYSAVRSVFGPNAKVLPNIAPLLANRALMARIGEEVDFSKERQAGVTKILNAFTAELKNASGTSATILSSVDATILASLDSIVHLSLIAGLIREEEPTRFAHDAEYFLAASQIADLRASNKADFRRFAAYCRYRVDKKSYEQQFAALKPTWKSVALKEDKRLGLVLEFPRANHISNGERDIVCFVASLIQARLKFKKQYSILVIDEIFDYLDEANLVACQYYITQMIAGMKADSRQLFPLIMTHLCPDYFKSYYFSDQKVCYLEKRSHTSSDVERIIIKRASIEDDLAKFFLHFHPEAKDLSAEFGALGLPVPLADSTAFRSHVYAQLERYRLDKSYDPIAVCCAVRVKVEEKAYNALAESSQAEFLSHHKTVDKLQFAAETGVEVPEALFMLGLIYNSAMHLRPNQDNITPVASRLSNLTIKHLIKTFVG